MKWPVIRCLGAVRAVVASEALKVALGASQPGLGAWPAFDDELLHPRSLVSTVSIIAFRSVPE